MPHYANGVEVNVGDYVVGKGYNIRGTDGEPRRIAGVVLGFDPVATACNIRVAITQTHDIPRDADAGSLINLGNTSNVYAEHGGDTYVSSRVEYGQCDHFTPVESLILP